MQITLPKSERHPLVQITASGPGYREVMMFDDSHTTTTIRLPEGITEEAVTVIAEFCDQFSKVDQWSEKITIKEAVACPTRHTYVKRETIKRPEPPMTFVPLVTESPVVTDAPVVTEEPAAPIENDADITG